MIIQFDYNVGRTAVFSNIQKTANKVKGTQAVIQVKIIIFDR